LPQRAHNCRKRKCGHSNDLRIKKKLKVRFLAVLRSAAIRGAQQTARRILFILPSRANFYLQ
jgi:hypothetical protein